LLVLVQKIDENKNSYLSYAATKRRSVLKPADGCPSEAFLELNFFM
jgi:hypothetical protein